eukprot:GHVT01094776.1.p1 GENE.GHVT01094776.1~~GHVT01094776.1.p1  ORF type:complete len:117 (-),score=1.96 GHVT01094776.1:1134-1484(-)
MVPTEYLTPQARAAPPHTPMYTNYHSTPFPPDKPHNNTPRRTVVKTFNGFVRTSAAYQYRRYVSLCAKHQLFLIKALNVILRISDVQQFRRYIPLATHHLRTTPGEKWLCAHISRH